MGIRPEIMEFAEAMERTMAKHDKDRGDAWKDEPFVFFQQRIDDEVAESKREDASLGEWVDIANFCMMVFWTSTHKTTEVRD